MARYIKSMEASTANLVQIYTISVSALDRVEEPMAQSVLEHYFFLLVNHDIKANEPSIIPAQQTCKRKRCDEDAGSIQFPQLVQQ